MHEDYDKVNKEKIKLEFEISSLKNQVKGKE